MKLYSAIILFFLNFGLFSFIKESPNYKVIYKINYSPNLLNLKETKTELAFLIIRGSQQSDYATENTFKKDSVVRLVKEGKISAYEVMNNPDKSYLRTGFNHYVKKDYLNQNIRVSTMFAVDNYIYNQTNELNWRLETDTLEIKNFVCHKATTTYEGRNYIAWYTTEIPISDGPYKFWGLPGLIVKIYDVENQYTFSLESFQRYSGEFYPIPFQSFKTFEITYEKFKILSKEMLENPLKPLTDRGASITFDGKEVTQAQLNKRKRNSIERY